MKKKMTLNQRRYVSKGWEKSAYDYKDNDDFFFDKDVGRQEHLYNGSRINCGFFIFCIEVLVVCSRQELLYKAVLGQELLYNPVILESARVIKLPRKLHLTQVQKWQHETKPSFSGF
jgi:hypothetical protein